MFDGICPPRRRQRPPHRPARNRSSSILAGAVGGGVASRLDPYGADDPSTETVKAEERLQDAGLRVPAVIAVVPDALIGKPATCACVTGLEGEIRERLDVAAVSGYYTTRSLPSSPKTVSPPTSPSR